MATKWARRGVEGPTKSVLMGYECIRGILQGSCRLLASSPGTKNNSAWFTLFEVIPNCWGNSVCHGKFLLQLG